MKVEKQEPRESSCNFCTPSYENDKRVLGYDFVFGFKRDHNNGLYAVICPDCLDELVAKAAEINPR